MTTFGDRLRRARKAKEWTQEELGRRVEVTKQTVSAWENGHDVPSFHAMVRLVRVLDVSADALLRDDEAPPSQRVAEQRADYAAPLSHDESAMLRAFRALDAPLRAAMLKMLSEVAREVAA